MPFKTWVSKRIKFLFFALQAGRLKIDLWVKFTLHNRTLSKVPESQICGFVF
jgi:hypothetical protein